MLRIHGRTYFAFHTRPLPYLAVNFPPNNMSPRPHQASDFDVFTRISQYVLRSSPSAGLNVPTPPSAHGRRCVAARLLQSVCVCMGRLSDGVSVPVGGQPLMLSGPWFKPKTANEKRTARTTTPARRRIIQKECYGHAADSHHRPLVCRCQDLAP